MNDISKFADEFLVGLMDGPQEELIEMDEYGFNSKTTELESKAAVESGLPESVMTLFSRNGGLNISWFVKEDSSVGGGLKFSKLTWLSKDEQSLIDQCDMDSSMDQSLKHFRVLDVPTMNTFSGFFIFKNERFSEIIYFYTQGDSRAKSLDIDINGYIELAILSRGFYYWQQVLIDIQRESESPETKKFKEWMPKIFTDFSWDSFVEKYNSLRISLN